MTNATSPSSSSTSSTEGNVVLETVVLSVIICVSILGNVSLWIVVLSSRTLRTITNMFILGLSAADLFVATVNMPITVYVIIKGYWNLSETACVITGYTNMLTLVTSVLSLCNISINRYIMVVRPGKFRDIYTKRKAISMITGVVLLAAFLSSFPLLGWAEYRFIPTHSFCFADWANHMSYAFFMIGCCFCIPFVVMTVCNIIIFRTVRKSRQKVKIAISPASVLDKSRNSAIHSEVSIIQDANQTEPEVNCSSTDDDGTFQTNETLDRISIDSSRYQELGQGHIDIDNNVNESSDAETLSKYRVSEYGTHAHKVGIDDASDDECRQSSARTSSRLSVNSARRKMNFINVGEDLTPEKKTNTHVDEDCISTASSTDSASLRAYNPAFDRTTRARGRPAARTHRQPYLTIPNDRILQQSKTLNRTSESTSSLHSSASEGSLRLKPIQITFEDNSKEENNLLAQNSNTSTEPTKPIKCNAETNPKLTGILINNNNNNNNNNSELTPRSEQGRKGSHNGVHRNVSINERKSTKTEIYNRDEISAVEKTKRRSIFSSRKHSSPPPKRREEIVLARSLAVVVVLFVLCWLPYCISMCLSIFYKGHVPRGFHMFTLIIGYANSGCNPIVYGAMNKRFAHGYKTLFCFWKDHRLSFNSSSM